MSDENSASKNDETSFLDETHTENENLLKQKRKAKTKLKDRIKSALNSIENNDPAEDEKPKDEAEAENKPKKDRKSKRTNSSELNQGQANDAFEETELNKTSLSNNDSVRNEKRKRRARRRADPAQDQDSNNDDKNILSITVHQTDRLRTDINIHRPVVRVHILDLDSEGQYVKKTKKDRHLLYYYEKENKKLDYVSPIMTTPFDFKIHKTIIPRWEEKVLFNEEFSHFTKDHPNVVILFELLDTSKSNDAHHTYSSQDTSAEWKRIAWAFLKIVGSDGSLNIEKKIRLQLFYSQAKYRYNQIDNLVPEVFSLFRNGPRVNYPSTLHVTLRSILAPNFFTPGIGSSYLMSNEALHGHNNRRDVENALSGNKSSNEKTTDDERTLNADDKKDKELKEKTVLWSRIAGLPCRIPNELAIKLPASKHGCYSVQFSSTGSYISMACVDDDNLYPIFVYDMPHGNFVMKFLGHFGLVYEMSWSKLDKYMVTASNDATARVIDVEKRCKDAYKLLPHPSFIYSVKFHPNSNQIICTSCYDKVIRVWTLKTKKSDKNARLLQELNGHTGYINSICFSVNGDHLYSADSVGAIREWNCYLNQENKSIAKEWTLKDEIIVEELANQCISYIHLHPNQFRLLVHLRDNQLKLVDLRLKTVVMRYKGTYTFVQNLKSALTPCGTFIFSCGADTKIYCWNVGTGDQVATASIHLNYIKPVRDMNFHPYDNFIAFCSFETNAPVYVLKFNPEKAAKDLSFIGLNNISVIEPVQETNEALISQRDLNSSREAMLLKQMPQNQLSVADFMSWTKNGLGSSITLSMADPNKKPEFKYKGPKEAQDLVVALYEYKAQRGDELDLALGDEIQILVKENDSWWMGKLMKNGQEGYFPASYVQEKVIKQHSFDAPSIRKIFNSDSDKKSVFTAKDLAQEYEKVYEQNILDTAKSPKTSKKEELTSKANAVLKSISDQNENEAKSRNSIKPPLSLLNATPLVETVSETPTKEQIDLSTTARKRDHTKRRAFGHIISGSPSSSTSRL